MWYGNVEGKRTVGNTGCGPIAMYNMFKDINQWESLPDIISIMEINEMNSDGGGTRTEMISHILNGFNVQYSYCTYDNYKKRYKNKTARFVISIQFNDKGYGHLIYVVKKKNKVCIYNAFNETNKPLEYKVLSMYAEESNAYVSNIYVIE